MKAILHVIDSDEPGGAEVVFVQLAAEMTRRGYRSLAVVPGAGWPAVQLQKRNVDYVTLHSKGAFNWRLIRQLVTIVKRNKIDIIQSHLLGSNVYCAIVGIITRTPVIATFHGASDISPTERFRRIKAKVMQFGINQFVAVSGSLKEWLIESGMVPRSKTTVIHNGIDTMSFSVEKSRQMLASLGIDENSKVVGTVGNMHAAKCYEDFVEMSRLVLDQVPNVHFVVAGNINAKIHEDLRTQAAKLGVRDQVHFMGFVDNVRLFLRGLDVFVLTSKSEGMSIATVEAMASGLPVVATRCGGPEEIIGYSQGGVLVDVGDMRTMARTVSAILDNPIMANRMGSDARKSIATSFSEAAMLRDYEVLYNAVWR